MSSVTHGRIFAKLSISSTSGTYRLKADEEARLEL